MNFELDDVLVPVPFIPVGNDFFGAGYHFVIDTGGAYMCYVFSCLIPLYLNELFFQTTHHSQEIRQLIAPILDSYDAKHLSTHQSFLPGKRKFYFV
jgi:hypothetical protein